MSEKAPLTVRKMPLSRGLAWVAGSWGLFRREPLRLLLISLFFLLLSQFFLSFSQSDALRFIVVLCLPVLSAGVLQAFFMVEQGGKPMLAVLFMPFVTRGSFGRLFLLGAAVMVLALLIVSLVLAGQVVDIDPEIITRIEHGDLNALQSIDPKVMETAVYAMAIGAAISACITYFAVPLIWFKRQSMVSAVITGLKALAVNWKPLLAIGVILALLALPIVVLLGSFYLSALSGGSGSAWLALLLLLLGSTYQLLLFGTQYLAFRDIFGIGQSAGIQVKHKNDQLVA